MGSRPGGPGWARALLAVGLLAACGTRVDETAATTPQTIVIQAGAGSSASGGASDDAADDGSGASGAAVTGGAAGGSGGAGPSAGGGAATGAGGSGAAVATAATGEPIRLGAVGTSSGIVGAALEGSFRGLTVWEEWVNSHGGIQGRPVEIIVVDDGADPGRHATAVRRLIREEGVVAFIGNFAPFTQSAGVPILEELQVPAIGGDGGEASWFTSPMNFPINGQTASRSIPAAHWALANLSQRQAAVYYVNEAEAPRQLAENFVAAWQEGGGLVVVNAGVSLAQPDFTGEAIRARNSGVDIVYLVLEKAACNRMFDAFRRQSFTPVILSTACVIDNALDEPELTTGRMYALHAAKPVLAGRSPAEDEVLAAIATYDPGLSPDGAFMFAWLAGKLLEAALAQPGTEISGPGIIDALHQLSATDLGGLTPAQSWPEGPHPEGRCGMVSLFDGQQFVLQTPEFVC